MKMPVEIYKELDAICLSFPEAYKTESFNHPCWRVAKKTFACFEVYNGEWVINFKASLIEQDDLVRSSSLYFIAPYTGRYGWVCRRIIDVDWAQLRRQIAESYRLNAPKSLTKAAKHGPKPVRAR
ncbi:MAG: MmcQ/YjbR family DNA-binding protein [Burkholderiales bacterium]